MTKDSYLVYLKTMRLKQAKNFCLLNLTHGIIIICSCWRRAERLRTPTPKSLVSKKSAWVASWQEIMFGIIFRKSITTSHPGDYFWWLTSHHFQWTWRILKVPSGLDRQIVLMTTTWVVKTCSLHTRGWSERNESCVDWERKIPEKIASQRKIRIALLHLLQDKIFIPLVMVNIEIFGMNLIA